MAILNGKNVLLVKTLVEGEVSAKLQEKTAEKNGEVLPDDGYYGLKKVIVNLPRAEGVVF